MSSFWDTLHEWQQDSRIRRLERGGTRTGGSAAADTIASLREQVARQAGDIVMLRAVIGALGWAAVSAGLWVERWFGLSLEGSFPLLITPAEAGSLEECLADGRAEPIQVIDVREPSEFGAGLGHIAGARLIPLGALAERNAEIDPKRPVVTVCRSGARSAQATVLLQKAGHARVANLAGGMLRWRAEGLPFEQGAN